MKISLAKAIAATATATALTLSGTAVATAQDTTTEDSLFAGSSSDEEVDPKEITEWISVFTSIIRALDTAMAFAAK